MPDAASPPFNGGSYHNGRRFHAPDDRRPLLRYAGPVLAVDNGKLQPRLAPEARRWVENAEATAAISDETIDAYALGGPDSKERLGRHAVSMHRSDPWVATSRGIAKSAIEGADRQIKEYDEQLATHQSERSLQESAICTAREGGWVRKVLVTLGIGVTLALGATLVKADVTNGRFLVGESGLFDEGTPDWQVVALALPAVLCPPILLKFAEFVATSSRRSPLRIAIAALCVVLALATPFLYGSTLGAMHTPSNPFGDGPGGEAGSDDARAMSRLVSTGMALVGLALYGLGVFLVWLAKQAVVWRRTLNPAWRAVTARIASTLERRLEWAVFREQLQGFLDELQAAEEAFAADAVVRWAKAAEAHKKQQLREEIERQLIERKKKHQRGMEELRAALSEAL